MPVIASQANAAADAVSVNCTLLLHLRRECVGAWAGALWYDGRRQSGQLRAHGSQLCFTVCGFVVIEFDVDARWRTLQHLQCSAAWTCLWL